MRELFHIPRRADPLPDAVYRDLVDMLFSMAIPIAFMGIAFAGVGGLVGWFFKDGFVAGLAVITAILTIVRLVTLYRYRRETSASTAIGELARWERAYALGSYGFALLLGLFNVRVLTLHYPVLHLIAVSLVFAFGAGVVSRISIRPVICVGSLLLAAAPTAGALLFHSFSPTHDSPLHGDLFLIETLLLAATTVMSLQSVRHIHHSMVAHLTVKHDLGFLAKRDALTKLPNRLLLRERFQKDMARVSRTGTRLALHFLDLDGFKAVNDVHGHPAGDAILREVAARLLATVRTEDTVSRVGGDEFIVLQAMISHDGEVEMLARRIIKKLSAPYRWGDADLRISVSVGIALVPEDGVDLEGLMERADTALYLSKTSGKARLQFYNAGRASSPFAASSAG